MKNLNWYKFTQGCVHGVYDFDEHLCQRMIIQATTERDALDIGKRFGIYLNGVDKQIDCTCCGDRWVSPNKIELPCDYDGEQYNTIEEYAQGETRHCQNDNKVPSTRIFFQDGTIKEFFYARN